MLTYNIAHSFDCTIQLITTYNINISMHILAANIHATVLLPLVILVQLNFTLCQHAQSVIMALSHDGSSCAIWYMVYIPWTLSGCCLWGCGPLGSHTYGMYITVCSMWGRGAPFGSLGTAALWPTPFCPIWGIRHQASSRRLSKKSLLCRSYQQIYGEDLFPEIYCLLL